MREERIIGNNIFVLLKNTGTDVSQMANDLGYSNDDLVRILEGRTFLSMEEIKEFADFFKVDVDDLLEKKTDEIYEKAGCIHYNHHFKNQANLETIMDIFDLICDIEEVL